MNRLISVVFVTLFVLFGTTSCNLDSSETQDLTIETVAMAIGYELKDSFDWTTSVDNYYNAIMQGKMSLDAAKLVENYLREYTHPLIANRLVKLAGVIGFDLDNTGSLIGVDKVNIHLLKVAAQGFRQGLLLTDLKSDTIAYFYMPLLPMDENDLRDSILKENQEVITLPAY